ncbi:aminotransferase class I/II-fold pyridoxal phosphate-dependent enzyme [Natranaerobius trueperi]|uniref:Aluminum resistance family protein n=1 Tax=Natranaerobius trueperi TaxID=759412 RepID=A0A226BVL3_9FIRM|nr:methionine gamma-lyase family protein [Natranaerobius trueperi]OWZ83088.1 hypothetical protein CDO51_10325 [Natranaerobius trueperi]
MIKQIINNYNWNFDNTLLENAQKVYDSLEKDFKRIDEIYYSNQFKVISAMQSLGLSEHHFIGSTGYGYGDSGREFFDELLAKVLGTESAIARHQWVSGTHTIFSGLATLLNPKDTLVSITGRPYDTLAKIIGLSEDAPENCLISKGINYKEVPLNNSGRPDLNNIEKQLQKLKPSVVFIQKSRGYSSRKTLTYYELSKLVDFVRKVTPNSKIFLDNCYGEFVETSEPGELDIDLMAGSFIKNPGGGLAPCGGYLAGKRESVEKASFELTAPGLGRDMGATPEGYHRLFIQGLYLAPSTVCSAAKGAIFSSAFFQNLGYEVSPTPKENRGDIIQEINLNTKENLISFVKGIQKAGVVDSHIELEPDQMPGYDHPVIMAAGTFVQGGSLELSADAPVRPPYKAYLQGGLTFPHVILGNLIAAQKIIT